MVVNNRIKGVNYMHLDALIFVDTNIFLDFYRTRRSDVSMSYIARLEDCKARLILGSQVEMEFKKNRQKVILETINTFKKPDWGKLTPPALFADAKATQMIDERKNDIERYQKVINGKIEKILETPSKYDDLFKGLQRLFKSKTDFNLGRDSEHRFKIRELAEKRFMLGYPPRKADDTSIGDAINWEWIVHCAINSKKDVVIVTRDTDYGLIYDKRSYLNDWLKIEFQQRVGRSRKLILTDKLSYALKIVDKAVSKEMEEAEQAWLERRRFLNKALFGKEDAEGGFDLN